MGISISGSNAISGLGGQDTDFDKVLSQLKKIEQTQLNRLEAWKSDWNLRYEAFTQIIDQIQAASSMLSQLSDKNNFVTKLVDSSNSNIVTAVANASAQDVQHTIKVNQVASNAIWANTGHIFSSKNDVINTTGTDQYFSYMYAGKRHDFKVPANTTLDSFASMINNSSDNPGIKVSIIQTGNGYVFQVAGKETGAANDLVILDSKLVGMDAAGSTSTWQTNNAMNIGEALTNPTSYVFDLVLQGGATKSVTVKGNATKDELVAALNNAAGGITATVDDVGNLALEGVQSFTLREADKAAYKPAGLKVGLTGDMDTKLNDAGSGSIAHGLADDDLIEFTLFMADVAPPNNTRTVKIKAGATQRDLAATLSRATQGSSGVVDTNMDKDGWSFNLAGVTGLSYRAVDTNKTVNPSSITTKDIEHKGVPNDFGTTLTAELTVTFDQAKFSGRIDGKTSDPGDGEALRFMFVKDNGQAEYITIGSDQSYEKLIDKIEGTFGSGAVEQKPDAKGNVILKITGVKEFTLIEGSVESAWTTELKASVSADSRLFKSDDSLTLENPPDLVYTITTNDGLTGTLTMPSGTSMEVILSKLKDTKDSAWKWVDQAGNDVSATPPSLNVKFTDAQGNPVEFADLDENTPVYLNMDNVQTATGPGMTGQIASSSNWSIQRAANAKYQVDNWPIEMESATNQISDVIEGVVVSIQDVGDARITVSTDITSVEQSIQNFLDAVNSVLLTVNDLMKYDESKSVTSNDPNDMGSENYSPSGLTSQKGNLLTGNYGVQLFKSRFSSLLGASPPGFQSRTSASDMLSGDVLASLANLGIKTDTDSTSDTYGLLVLAPSSPIAQLQTMDKENYNDMITNHLEAVVDFFCASGTGTSSSTEFRYGSHVEGITKAGNYEVKYKVDADGKITDVTIGGEPAKRDESQPGNYFSVATGDPRGLSILIDDLTVGDHPPSGDPMYVRIKQGLVQTTNNFLKDELVFNDINIPANATPQEIADALALKSKNGALMSLRDNYMTVMEGIDAKIEREQRRIATWEARQKKIFANLEALLNSYGEQQKQLEAQLNQLSDKS